jgi:hypothetical protein
MNEQRTYAVFLRRLLIAAALAFGLPYGISEALKIRAGELPPADVADRQMKSKQTLYLSGLDQNVNIYKLELTARQNPAIIAVGSSRALQVRDFFFNDSFVNWGLTVSSIAALDWSVNEILKLPKKPKLVIFFLDPWWFNGKFDNARDVFAAREPRTSNIYKNTWLLGQRLFARKPMTQPNRLGIAAIDSNQGYDFTGSFHYVSRITVGEPYDIKFQRTLRQIDTQDQRWIGAGDVNPLAIERWNAAKARLEQNGIAVVEILPPFPPSITARIREKGNHTYISKLGALLPKAFDYMDARTLPGVTDCEFVDGIHGGEIIYAKVLLDAAAKNASLRAVLRADALRPWVAANQGHTSPATIGLYGHGAIETDFLKLGCAKRKPENAGLELAAPR